MLPLVPILAITTPFLTAAVIVISVLAANHRKDMAKYDLVEKALKSDSSPEMLSELIRSLGTENEKPSTPPRQRHLIHATIFLALAISFFAMMFIIGGDDVTGLAASGAVLGMLGLAKLVIALFIVGKNTERLER
jgi:hypothetical protein